MKSYESTFALKTNNNSNSEKSNFVNRGYACHKLNHIGSGLRRLPPAQGTYFGQ